MSRPVNVGGAKVIRDESGAPILVGIWHRELGWIWRGHSQTTAEIAGIDAPFLERLTWRKGWRADRQLRQVRQVSLPGLVV